MQVGVSKPLGDVVEGGGGGDAVGEITLVIKRILHGDAFCSPLLLLASQHLHLAYADNELVCLKFEAGFRGLME